MNRDYMYGFVSNNELSAGLWSNSEHDGSSVATSVTGWFQKHPCTGCDTEKTGLCISGTGQLRMVLSSCGN